MSAKTTEAISFLDEKLKKVVTEALATVVTEKRDDPMRHLASLLKEQSLANTEVFPPIDLKIPTVASETVKSSHIDVRIRNVCPKTELTLPKLMLYGLHMPTRQQWQAMMDYIREENSGMHKLIMIIETEDPGKDILFVDGVPYYGDLSEKRAERRRRLLREGALNVGNISRLEQSIVSHGSATKGKDATLRTAEWLKGTADALNGTDKRKRGASVVTLDVNTSSTALEDTQRPQRGGGLTVSEAASAASAGGAASTFQRTLSDVGNTGRRRTRSLRDVSSFEALKNALLALDTAEKSFSSKSTAVHFQQHGGDASAPQHRRGDYLPLADIIASLKSTHSSDFTIEAHTVSPTESMSNPISLYERIDSILGVSDRDDVQPVLVVSFRSREFDWRRLMCIVNATQRPLIEFKRLRDTAMVEVTTTHKRFTMSSTSNEEYWSAVAKRRIERDARRKALAQSREAELAAHKAERMAAAIAERAEATAAAAATNNGSTNSGTLGLGSTMSAAAMNSTMNPSNNAKSQKEIVLQPDEFEINHIAETQRRQRIDAARERRRQREDVIFDRLCESERAKKAVKLQALIRGYLSRRRNRQQSIMESTSAVFVMDQHGDSAAGGKSRPGMGMGVDGTTKIDAPALMRRVYLKANESMAGLLTSKLPMPKTSAVRHEFWVPRRVHIPPKYDGDASSDEEYFDHHTIVVPPRSDTRRPVLFNALLRLQEVSREVGDDLYDWAINIQKQFVGISMLQQRAYDALKTASLDLIHIVFLEAHHRRLYTQSTLRADSTFSDYIAADFFELTSWFSSPHFMSLSTAPEVASALQYGPQNPIYDHVLYPSGDITTLPWGGEAPPNPAQSGHQKLFMPNWSDDAYQSVATTVDMTPVKVFQKQIEYATITGLPCWWFSICPHLGVYVNNQPFVAARRPVYQEIEGCEIYNVLHPTVKDMQGGGGTGSANGADGASDSIIIRAHSPLPRRSVSPGGAKSPSETPQQHGLSASPSSRFVTGGDATAGAASFKFDSTTAGMEDHSPTQTKGFESMTFSYSKGVSIRLRTWFGVHWTEMERKFRNRIASLAANNKFHIPAYVAHFAAGQPMPRSPTQSKAGAVGKADADNLSVSSGDSKVQPYNEQMSADVLDAVGVGKDFAWIDDTHASNAPFFTESLEAVKVVQTLTNIIPPPRPVLLRNPDDGNEHSTRRRAYSRNTGNNASARRRGSSIDQARSFRRLQSVTSMRIGPGGGGASGAASRAPSIIGDGTTRMDDTRMMTMGPADMTTTMQYTSPNNALQRIRTANKVAEKLFKDPLSRYIRSPGLEVSGYQWWCNLDQFISLIHKGLREKASIVIAITDEAQVFYSLVGQLVSLSLFSKEDEVYKIFRMMQAKLAEEAQRVVKEAEEEKQKNFDPDNLGLINAKADDLFFAEGCSAISAISTSEDDDEDRYVTAQEMLGLNSKEAGVDVSFSGVGAGFLIGETPTQQSPLAFLDMFAALCEPMSKGGKTEVVKAWGAFNHFVRLGAGSYFITSLTSDIEMAEKAETLKEVRQRVTRACRTSERYASLFLVYLFLRSLPPGEGTTEPPSFVAWLAIPEHAKIMEWLNFIDPWVHCPGRSPDPHHTRYSSIYRRWTEDTFITAIH